MKKSFKIALLVSTFLCPVVGFAADGYNVNGTTQTVNTDMVYDSNTGNGISVTNDGTNGGDLTVSGATQVTTNSNTESGILVTGTGSTMTIDGVAVTANENDLRGISAMYGGSLTITNADVTTNENKNVGDTGKVYGGIAAFGGASVEINGAATGTSNVVTAHNNLSNGISTVSNALNDGTSITIRNADVVTTDNEYSGIVAISGDILLDGRADGSNTITTTGNSNFFGLGAMYD
ncbi:MAG: hypothetical protein LBU87_01430, partial [Lactobacillales bacterium]|nr:hypothetical protein [Lactobacillales bacterium]